MFENERQKVRERCQQTVTVNLDMRHNRLCIHLLMAFECNKK